jgi:UDP-glucose 4-epimerase
MEYILVTGGLGFIGSNVVACLCENGYDNIVIIDNFANSEIGVLDRLKLLYSHKNIVFVECDVRDEDAIDRVFSTYKINAVFHMAALKSVKESIEQSLEYYNTNILGTINILNCVKQYKVRNFVFSSSATVYGDSPMPLTEGSDIGNGITNPYGRTKYIIELMLKDLRYNKDINIIVLRYFNPIGAHYTGLLGENPKGVPNNIFPYIMKVAKGELPFLGVFGDDYNTVDGTGVRDYIDINDLSMAHICAYNKFKHLDHSYNVFNIGTGNGTSVLELVRGFERASGVKIPYTIVDRRPGDLDEVYCSLNPHTVDMLSWIPRYSIRDSCANAWKFVSNDSNKID